MKLEICKLDSNRNLAERELKWLVQAIDSFSKNVTIAEATANAGNMSNAFSYYALPAYVKNGYSTNFIFDKNSILRENQGAVQNNSNPAALACFCRKDGLLYDVGDQFRLSDIAKELLLNEIIHAADYGFVLLTKQWIKVDGECKRSLLPFLYEQIELDPAFLKRLFEEDSNKLKSYIFGKITGKKFVSGIDIVDFGRFDILCNMLEISGLVSRRNSEPIISNEAKEILIDFKLHEEELTKYQNSDIAFYEYISECGHGIFDILKKDNAAIYAKLYPNLVAYILKKNIMTNTPEEFVELIKKNFNLVLTGAPGTGKTFLAKNLAAELVGAESWSSLTSGQKRHVEFVQFHPSYDYTDFVEGLRPDENGNFVYTAGTFKEFCAKASQSEDEVPFVFIIDEINRGEISKIFGELFYSIEPNYRGPETRVKTQYNKMVPKGDVFEQGFYVPKNVYIIGTMNDIDRGVEAMDFAIRRRFAWREVTVDESADIMEISGLARNTMNALNAALRSKGLSEAYCIGAAYFFKLEGSDYESLWKYHLRGIVAEYLRGEPECDTKLKEVEDAYKTACNKPVEDS